MDLNGPKWTSLGQNGPKWTILVHFGLANAKVRFGIRSFWPKWSFGPFWSSTPSDSTAATPYVSSVFSCFFSVFLGRSLGSRGVKNPWCFGSFSLVFAQTPRNGRSAWGFLGIRLLNLCTGTGWREFSNIVSPPPPAPRSMWFPWGNKQNHFRAGDFFPTKIFRGTRYWYANFSSLGFRQFQKERLKVCKTIFFGALFLCKKKCAFAHSSAFFLEPAETPLRGTQGTNLFGFPPFSYWSTPKTISASQMVLYRKGWTPKKVGTLVSPTTLLFCADSCFAIGSCVARTEIHKIRSGTSPALRIFWGYFKEITLKAKNTFQN